MAERSGGLPGGHAGTFVAASGGRAGIEMSFTFNKTQPRPSVAADAPFRMLVVGDFGGHTSRAEVRPATALRPFRVDVDSLEGLFRKIAPRIQIQLGDQPAFIVDIDGWGSFHPDHLFARHAFFAPMRELRKQLLDPKTFPLAAALLDRLGGPQPSPPSTVDVAEHADDLERLLGKAPSEQPHPATAPGAIDALLKQAVAPHVVDRPDARQADMVASADGMTAELMRAVLHDPAFQSTEAAWRGLDRLVRELDPDEELQLFVLDITRDELVQDFARATSLEESALYRLVVDEALAQPWSVIVDFTPYARTQRDAALLARLGAIVEQGSATWLAGMEWPAFTSGYPSADDERAWLSLRQSPSASSIGIAAPAVLLRLPYGRDTDPTEQFVFVEQSSPPTGSRYLWGSPALVLGQLLAASFRSAGGWDFCPGDDSALVDLPIHVTRQDGESVQTPCAQVWLSESKMEALLGEGFMPILSVQGRGEVRVARFQSIAAPAGPLRGPWRG